MEPDAAKGYLFTDPTSGEGVQLEDLPKGAVTRVTYQCGLLGTTMVVMDFQFGRLKHLNYGGT